MTLRASEVKSGAKVMLMASQGLHQGVLFLPRSPFLVSENSVILIVSVACRILPFVSRECIHFGAFQLLSPQNVGL